MRLRRYDNKLLHYYFQNINTCIIQRNGSGTAGICFYVHALLASASGSKQSGLCHCSYWRIGKQ